MNHYGARVNKPIPSPILTTERANGDLVEYTVDEETRLSWIEKYGAPKRPWRKRV